MTKEMIQNSEELAASIVRMENNGIDVGDMSLEELCDIIAKDSGFETYSIEQVKKHMEFIRYCDSYR